MKNKSIKKLIILLILLLLPVIAKADDTYTITINQTTNQHTYEAYQIFTGTINNDKLANIAWGTGVNTTTLFTDIPDYADPKVAAAEAATESGARNLANTLNDYLSNTIAGTCTPTLTSCSISGLAPGYYLIKDQDQSLDQQNAVYTPFIMMLSEDTTIQPKLGTIATVNQRIFNGSTYTEATSASIGSTVKYRIDVTLPAELNNYPNYKLVIHDELPQGITLDTSSLSIEIDNQEETTGFSLVTDTDGFEIIFNDVKLYNYINPSSVITAYIEGTLNDNASFGSTANVNTAYATYTNNFNNPTTDTGTSDRVSTYLYSAVFKLYNMDEELDEFVEGGTYVLIDSENNEIDPEANDDDTIFTFSGIGTGIYTLRQTSPSPGYEDIQDITVAFLVNTSSGAISVQDISNTNVEYGMDNGSYVLKLPNTYNALLAFTGGRGTLIYTIVGLSIMISVIIIATIRKRIKKRAL